MDVLHRKGGVIRPEALRLLTVIVYNSSREHASLEDDLSKDIVWQMLYDGDHHPQIRHRNGRDVHRA